MPLIIITGYPCSGKTKRCQEIKEYLENNCDKKVHVISEENFLTQCNTDKNKLCYDSKKQKEVRGLLKCNVVRLLGPDVVVLDASNNIKGFRYELYCASKCYKTPQCVIECAINLEKAWQLNEARENNKYSRDAFDAFVSFFEPPNNSNRWDSPLITIQFDDKLPSQEIYDALFTQHTPQPNQSTVNSPCCNSTYLSDLDKVTKDVIQMILLLQSDGVNGKDIKLPDLDVNLAVLDERINPRKLSNFKKQFISYYKLNPLSHSQDNIAKLFVQFINSSIIV